MNKHFPKFVFIVIFSLFLFFSGNISTTSAQVSEGIQIKPAIIEDRVDPGETYLFTFTVTNISENEKIFYLTKQNIKGVSADGLPVFADEQEEKTPYELSSWIDISGEPIVIGAGGTKKIPFSIKVPDDASPGAHFGGVFIDVRPPKLRTIGAGVGFKVGTIINLRISGDVIEEARLREFTADKLVYNIPEVNFRARIENIGNVLIRPHGLIEITNMFGKKIADIRINEKAAGVFPESEKVFEVTWDYERFTFGRHQAVVSLVYGEDGRKTITGIISIWVLPIKPLLISFGSLLGLILLLVVLIKVHIRKKLREMQILSRGKMSRNVEFDLHGYKHHKPTSKLMVVTIFLSILVVVFLFLLFFLFA